MEKNGTISCRKDFGTCNENLWTCRRADVSGGGDAEGGAYRYRQWGGEPSTVC